MARTSASRWRRILEFGDAKSNYLYLTPRSSSSTSPVRFAFSINGGEQRINVANNIPSNGTSQTHIAFTFDDLNNRANLYIDGNLSGGRNTESSLSELNDIQNWLGRSQYPNVPFFNSNLHEFRIYNRALTTTEVQSSYTRGIDESNGPEIHSFTSSTPKIVARSIRNLEWDIRNASSIQIDNLGVVTDSNSITITPEKTTTFRLTASNSAGSVTIPFTVTVESEPNQDTDGDGWADEIETFLGTDPNDANDLFLVEITSEQAFNPPAGKIHLPLEMGLWQDEPTRFSHLQTYLLGAMKRNWKVMTKISRTPWNPKIKSASFGFKSNRSKNCCFASGTSIKNEKVRTQIACIATD